MSAVIGCRRADSLLDRAFHHHLPTLWQVPLPLTLNLGVILCHESILLVV